jgi:hypothetical protein
LIGQKQRQQEIISTRTKTTNTLVVVDEPDIALTFKLALEIGGEFQVDTFYQPYLALTLF